MKKRLPRTNTSTFQKIGLILFGLVLFFVILEAGMRLGGFILLSIQEYGNLQSIKQKGAYRILCLGESTTQGQYPQYLEKILNSGNVGVRFNVFDKGKVGTTTWTILGQAEAYLNDYRPDMVVAMMGVNDWGSHIPFEPPATSKWTIFIRSFKVYKLGRLLWLHIQTLVKEPVLRQPGEETHGFKRNQDSYEGELRKGNSREEFSVAERRLKKNIEADPSNDNEYFRLGLFYRSCGRRSQARDCFKKVIALNPHGFHAYYELSQLCQNLEESLAVENFLEKIIAMGSPGSDRACYELGRLLWKRSQFSLAKRMFKKAIELNPQNDNAYVQLAWLFQDRGEWEQAEDTLRKAIAIMPRNSIAYFELGVLYMANGKFAAAEEVLKKAVDLDLRSVRVFGALASLYAQMGKPALAEKYASQIKDLSLKDYAPDTANNFRRLKSILNQRGVILVCIQYPMRSVVPLRKIFENDRDVLFVDNEKVFKEAVRREGYKEYFVDIFGGDFGHCTKKGNELLAQNIAGVILKEVFNK